MGVVSLDATCCGTAANSPRRSGLRTLHLDGDGVLTKGTDFTLVSAPPSLVSASVDGRARLWNPDCAASLTSLEGSSHRALTSAAFSPGGRFILTASMAGTVELWDMEEMAISQSLRGHRGPVMSAVFSRDGTSVLTAGEDRTARLWRADSGACFQTIGGHEEPLRAAAFSRDSCLILTASDDRTAKLWAARGCGSGDCLVLRAHRQLRHSSGPEACPESSSAKPLLVLRDHALPVVSCGFSPDGASAVTSSEDGCAKLWSLVSGEVLETLRDHSRMPVRSAEFSNDGKMVVTASWDCTATVWFLGRSGAENEYKTLGGHSGAVTHATFCSDDKTVATSSLDGTVRLWSVDSGTCERTLGDAEGGSAVTCVSFAQSFKL